MEAQRLSWCGRAGSLQRLVWKLGLWKSGRGLREGCESLDLIHPVGNVGEDARVDGVLAAKPQLASPIRTQN